MEIRGPRLPEYQRVLTPEALAFVESLAREFDPRRRQLLEARAGRQRDFDSGRMPDFLAATPDHLPTLAGVKFSNPDLMAYQKCLHTNDHQFDIPWGTDEYLLAALALGAAGGVGSSYNFAPPIYNRMITAFTNHDLPTARTEQYRSVQLIDLLASHGYMPAAKATMSFLGVDVGPARLPHPRLTPDQINRLRSSLEQLGFFDWVLAPSPGSRV